MTLIQVCIKWSRNPPKRTNGGSKIKYKVLELKNKTNLCDCEELWWRHCVEKRWEKEKTCVCRCVGVCVAQVSFTSLSDHTAGGLCNGSSEGKQALVKLQTVSVRSNGAHALPLATFMRRTHELRKKLLWAGTMIPRWPGWIPYKVKISSCWGSLGTGIRWELKMNLQVSSPSLRTHSYTSYAFKFCHFQIKMYRVLRIQIPCFYFTPPKKLK